MDQQTTTPTVPSRHRWEPLEGLVREPIQRFIHALLAEAVTAV
jgi:hypothetical protein